MDRFLSLEEWRQPGLPEKEHFQDLPSSLADQIDMIFYINLDKRTDRRQEIESELNGLGLAYERFSAIPHEFGAIGCSSSHLAVLKLAKERGYRRILVLEDDFQLVVLRDVFKEKVSEMIAHPFDVCFVAHNAFKSIAVKGQPFWRQMLYGHTTSGYLVNSHYYDTLIRMIEASIPLLEQTRDAKTYAIDVVYGNHMSLGKWYYPTKRLARQRPSYSDIRHEIVDYPV